MVREIANADADADAALASWVLASAIVAGSFHGASIAGRIMRHLLPASSYTALRAYAYNNSSSSGRVTSISGAKAKAMQANANANFKAMIYICICAVVGASMWVALSFWMTVTRQLHHEYMGLAAVPFLFACLHYLAGFRRGTIFNSNSYIDDSLDYNIDIFPAFIGIFLVVCVSAARGLVPVLSKYL